MDIPFPVDDQPIAATFFGEGQWLTSFITPKALEVEELHKDLTQGLYSIEDKITALWQWVASQVRYKSLIRGRLWIEGKSSSQDDLWNSPSVTRRVQVGNCVNKAFLLASLIRNDLPPDSINCVLGNLYHDVTPGGHAWVQVNLGSGEYIVESTRADIPALIPVATADKYEAIHLFNDERVYTIQGRTVMTPYQACYSEWLRDYIDFAYVEGRK